jgi:hypothetical protein
MYLPSYRLPGLRARPVKGRVRNSRREIGNAVSNQNALEIDRRATFGGSDNILVDHLASEDGKVPPLTNEISHLEFVRAGLAYGIGLSGKVERAPRELSEGLKEDGDEGLDVLGSVFGGLHNFAVIRIREANSNATRLLAPVI